MSKLMDIIRSELTARKSRRFGPPKRIEDTIREDISTLASGKFVGILILCLKDDFFCGRYKVSEEYSYLKYYAADSLGDLGDPAAVVPLGIALKDKNAKVCESAANALHKIGDARAVPYLVAGLEDNSVQPPWQQINLDARYAIGLALVSLNNPWGVEIGKKVLAQLAEIQQ